MDHLLIIFWSMFVLVLLTYVSGFHLLALEKWTDAFSYIINEYLLSTDPVISCDGAMHIPTCPYQWPNGQGDVAKFLEGEKNSSDWVEKHGGVYRIWSGMTSEIVLTRPEDVKTVFKDSDLHRKGINNDAGWLMGELLGKCLGLITGAEWRRVRASTGDAFSYRSASASISRITNLTKEHFEDLYANGGLSQGILSPAKDLRLLPFWIMTDYLYGSLNPALLCQLQDLIPLRESIFNEVIQGGTTRFFWSKLFPSKVNRNLGMFKSKWAEFNDVAYKSSKLAMENTVAAQMYESMKDGSIDHLNLLHTLDEMLFGNLDVTIGAISWNPLFLAANEDVQTHLREEIREVRARTGEGTASVAWEKYLQRPDTLLAASILESARLKPLAAFSIPQAAPTDRVVGGFRVPAGTNFIVDTHSLNIRNPYWGDDGTEYRPSRFLDRKPSEMRYQYWRVGFGPRQCLGKYVADLILRVLVAHLVENYQLTLAPTSTWDRNPSVWIAHPDTILRCEKLSSF